MAGQVPYVSQSVGMTAGDAQQVGTEATALASTTNLIDSNKVVRVAANLTGASITGDSTVSGKLTVGSGTTGLVAMPYTGGGYGALYSTGVAPSAANYAFLNNGVNTLINASTGGNVYTAVAGNLVSTQSATQLNLNSNLAVTGTLSTSGALSVPVGTVSVNAIQFGGVANCGFYSSAGTLLITPQSLQILGSLYAPAMSAISGTGVAVAGTLSATTTIRTGGFTVATLPAGVAGDRAHVTDALAPAFGAAVVGGGAVVIPVIKNATVWVVG